MASKPDTMTSFLLVIVLVEVAAMFSGSHATSDKDRTECVEKLIGIMTCLPYIGGDAPSPPIDCCTGLKPVIDDSKKCLCLVIKDRDDPTLGLKVNLTIALGLPDACHTPTNITECIDLLHLAPNSTEAKAFNGSLSGGSTATAPSAAPSPPTPTGPTTPPASASGPTPSSPPKSYGGAKLRTSWALEIASTASILFILHIFKQGI